MTQEELTMVVNATIEYHRPTQQKVVESPVKLSKHKKNDKLIQHLGEPNPYHHRCNQRSNSLVRSDESVLEMFQHMLERKEKHFYALRATEIAVNDEVRDNQNQETATSRVATANQHQQTTSYLRDQTPDTENLSHQPMVNESTQFSEFNTSVHSLPPAVSPYELMEPIAGPTLADLASHRKRERYPSSFQSYPSSIASRSSSSPSSATDQVNSHFQSSYSSKYSSSNNFSSHSIMSSAKSGAYSRHCSHTSKRSYRCNGTSSTVSSLSRSSKHSSHRNVSPASSIETTLPDNCDFTLSKKDELLEVSQVAVAPPISDSQVSSRAELVTWELDLSNFAF
ncbi:hypothetical protein PHMEG_0004859 [Phytophthora megakarya]|uniref:Uncharacterized protein n=1 Tax=Phytophthora megakarya TaxID=4795 RepID=A0A225WST4_9STRA|nr:hypothetical protein PHMEG_0004859 [Phytophthora megakarya]